VRDSASQNNPCGKNQQGVDVYVGITDVNQNGTIHVQWTNDGTEHDNLVNGGGTKTCRFALSKSDTNVGQFSQNVLTNISCGIQKYELDINVGDVTPGIWYLQYWWNAGDDSDWYGCTRINVIEAGLVITDLPVDTTRTISVGVDDISDELIFRVALPPITNLEKHLFFTLSVSSNSTNTINGTISATTIPKSYEDGITIQSDSFEKTATLCNLANTNYAYVTLFPNNYETGTNFTGEVTISVTLYDSQLEIDVTNDVLLKDNSLTFYWTESSTTTTNKRRVIVSGTGANVYLSGPYRSCTSNQYEQPKSVTNCQDLGRDVDFTGNNNKQYFGIYVAGDLNGFFRVEKGSCDTYSGVSRSIILTFIMVMVVVLF
jgi:hypothetical protein